MKKICIAFLASLACLFTVSCDKQEDDAPLYTTNSFKVEAPEFVDENGSKVYLQYTDLASSLIYEEGDQVYINGHAFTLVQDGGWRAISSDGDPITGKRFLVTYVDGAVSHFDSAAGTYLFNLNTTLSSSAHNKIILGGVAENAGDYVIKLKPACAILRINTGGAGASWTYAKVGFEANKVPKTGTINVSDRTLGASGSDYLTGVTSGGSGQFLNMRYSNPSSTGEDDYWYVAIPIKGNSVTTTLYLEWNDGSTTVQRKTQSPVTLQKGYVYTLGTNRQSPFNVNGIGNKRFKVSNSQYVRFSAGNLQCIRVEDPDTYERTNKWRFAEHQYDMIQGGNSAIGDGNTSTYIDLFGWGTSGNNTGRTSGIQYEPYATSGTFGFPDVTADLAGTSADWGIANRNNIYYGNRISTVRWRTLTQAEWYYLINRSGLCGLAIINGMYQGLVLLPDEGWSLPEGCSWNSSMSSYSDNSYTMETWDKMEMAGAIFLPAAGYRSGTSISAANAQGIYWSTSNTGASTTPGSVQAYPLTFTSSGANTTTATPRVRGCSVRLVMNN